MERGVEGGLEVGGEVGGSGTGNDLVDVGSGAHVVNGEAMRSETVREMEECIQMALSHKWHHYHNCVRSHGLGKCKVGFHMLCFYKWRGNYYYYYYYFKPLSPETRDIK